MFNFFKNLKLDYFFHSKDSREESVLGSIPLPSYVISPVGPEDHINRKYSFKVHLLFANYMVSFKQPDFFQYSLDISLKRCHKRS